MTTYLHTHKSIHKFTWHQAHRNLNSIIDCVIQRRKSQFILKDFRVCGGPKDSADHFMLKTKVYIPHKNEQDLDHQAHSKKILLQHKYNLSNFQQKSVKLIYRWRLATKLNIQEVGIAEEL